MRAVVLALAVLAGLKLWAHQSLYRSATDQALLHAYTNRAVAACQSQSQRVQDTSSDLLRVDWSAYRSAHVEIGDKSTDVSLWQIDHELWNRRYKTPFIRLTAKRERSSPHCIFNVMTGEAEFHAA